MEFFFDLLLGFVMDSLLKNSSRVFSEDHRINLYYINELYQNIGNEVANRLKDIYGIIQGIV